MSYRNALITPTPGTPEPKRSDFQLVAGDVAAIFFDFDGTLTASPGDAAKRCCKQVELMQRASMLEPRLRALRDASLTLGIISKSSEQTILAAIGEAGLAELFNGPVLGRAVSFEGKAGFVEELLRSGSIRNLGADGGLRRVLLVDDDLRELERARALGIQTYAAPKDGGLQEEDFDLLFESLGVPGGRGTLNPSAPLPPVDDSP